MGRRSGGLGDEGGSFPEGRDLRAVWFENVRALSRRVDSIRSCADACRVALCSMLDDGRSRMLGCFQFCGRRVVVYADQNIDTAMCSEGCNAFIVRIGPQCYGQAASSLAHELYHVMDLRWLGNSTSPNSVKYTLLSTEFEAEMAAYKLIVMPAMAANEDARPVLEAWAAGRIPDSSDRWITTVYPRAWRRFRPRYWKAFRQLASSFCKDDGAKLLNQAVSRRPRHALVCKTGRRRKIR